MKLLKSLVLTLIVAVLLVGCGEKKADAPKEGEKPAKEGEKATAQTIEDLKVVFVPSRDAKDIKEQTEPLKKLLQDELKKEGYDVKKVTIDTLTSYEAAGEALSSGSAHIGLIPGGTYAAFADKGVKVVLASTRNGLKYDTENPKDWNTGEANDNNTDIVTYYRGIIIAGPSEKGQALSKKVNAGEKLTWEELSDAVWCHASTTSGSGFQYPSLWLHDQFQKTLFDINESNRIKTQSYPDAANKLALGQCDVAPGYNDFRMDNAEKWSKEWGKKDIWTETQVIGVTEKIQNDTVSVSAKTVDDKLAKAIGNAFINLAKTEEGAKAIKIYNHKGYMEITDADYEGAKKVNKLVQETNK